MHREQALQQRPTSAERHYGLGQSIAYARINGIAPPWTGGGE